MGAKDRPNIGASIARRVPVFFADGSGGFRLSLGATGI